MTEGELQKLTYSQLLNLQNKVALAKAKKQNEERAALKEKISALAATSGFQVSELFGGKPGRKPSGKVAPKFANPKDPAQTRTGRGRKPLWVVAELKKGKKIESFAL